MLTRDQTRLAQEIVSAIKEGHDITKELIDQLITATTGTEVEKAEFRNFIAGFIAPLLTDKQLYKFTKTVMTHDEGGYLLRDIAKLSGDLYKVYAQRIGYSPNDEKQPDSMIILNKLVYASIQKDKSIKSDKLDEGVATGIQFKLAPPVPIDITPEKLAVVKAYHAEAKKKQQYLIQSFKIEGSTTPEFKEGVKNVYELDDVFNPRRQLAWKLKELEEAMRAYKDDSATYKAAAKVLQETHSLVKYMDAKDDTQTLALLSAISAAVLVLKNPKGTGVIKGLEVQATKHNSGIGAKVSSALKSLVNIFKWNKKSEVKASQEGIFKFASIAKPLAELAAAPAIDARAKAKAAR